MTKRENINVTSGIWYLGEMNSAGLRSIEFLQPQKPRYVQTRRNKKNDILYYWCAPAWAKQKGFFVRSEALGDNLQLAYSKAHKLNSFLDSWRLKENTEKLNKNNNNLDNKKRSKKPIKWQLSN